MNRTVSKSHYQPGHHQRWKIAQLAFASRILVLLAMSLSCSILPDFHPGDDVLQFDLRLSSPPSSLDYYCFCLQGHECDVDWQSRRRVDGSSSCADNNSTIHHANNNGHNQKSNDAARYTWLDRFYAFILPPVTKWDAARFLTLSVDPWARYPPHSPILMESGNDDQIGGQTCSSSNNTTICEAPPADNEDDGRRFYPSEQAHAFLPFLPLVIRFTAIVLTKVIPFNILPPTYEATTALSAIMINMFAFVIAAISLYDLTIFLLKRNALENNSNTTKDDADDHSKMALQNETSYHLLARTTAQLFCINPAGVFFTAAYSESIFAMLTFAGHAIAARGQFYQSLLRKEMTESQGLQKWHGRSCWWWANVYWIASTVLWMLASYTRSNGTFSSIWWLLTGISKCCSCIIIHHRAIRRKRKSAAKVAFKCLSLLLFHGVLALLVAYPVYYHDRRGYNFHCLESNSPISQPYHFPAWCDHDGIGLNSLYAHVQRKHWNVGLFRYYEMKQIPNFILALPVLALSFASAALWIGRSWSRHMNGASGTKSGTGGPAEGICRVTKDVIPWAFLAMGASSYDFYPSQQQDKANNKYVSNAGPSTATLDGRILSTMLYGPKFLSYYAILAGFAFVGAFLAHVQISTRLICSSCPAFYWFVSSLLFPFMANQHDGKGRCSVFGFASQTPLLYFYFALYNILGVVMHVNWLPWT